MWCAEGFVLVDTIQSRLSDAISSYQLSTQWNGSSAEFRRDLTAKEIFPEWAVWGMLRNPALDTFICSPRGETLKASTLFFSGPARLSFEDFSLPVEDESSLDELVKEILDREREEDYSPWVVDDGFFVDPWSWTVRNHSQIEERLERHEEDRQSKSFRDFHVLKAAAIEAKAAINFDDHVWSEEDDDGARDFVSDLSGHVANFEGWSFCFRDGDIPSDLGKLLQITGISLKIESEQKAETLSPSQIVEKIVQLHREGHPVIRDEIKKELAPTMNAEQWRETWKMATAQQPELSKRGPKRRKRGL